MAMFFFCCFFIFSKISEAEYYFYDKHYKRICLKQKLFFSQQIKRLPVLGNSYSEGFHFVHKQIRTLRQSNAGFFIFWGARTLLGSARRRASPTVNKLLELSNTQLSPPPTPVIVKSFRLKNS